MPFSRRYTLNEDAFAEAENDPVKSYWLGMLMGDGTVGSDGKTLQLNLAGEDQVFLEDFRRFLGTNHPLYVEAGGWRPAPVTGKPSFRQPKTHLSVHSRLLVSTLIRYGVGPRKSLNAKPPACVVNGPHASHFYRGLIDADGSVFISVLKDRWGVRRNKTKLLNRSCRQPVVSLCGSYDCISAFLCWARTITPTSKKPCQINPIWQTAFSSQAAVRVIQALYQDCPVALPRKVLAARQIIKEFEVLHDRRTYLTHGDDTLSLTEWSLRTGIKKETIAARLRYGWTVGDALTMVRAGDRDIAG